MKRGEEITGKRPGTASRSISKPMLGQLRQIREWLDDMIEDELQFTPEFERSVEQAERDMADGKSARVREPEARERGDAGLLHELRYRLLQAAACTSRAHRDENRRNRFAPHIVSASTFEECR
jgi:hypothetical protein